MHKFFSYIAAGVLLSSLGVFACSTTTTTSDDDDDDTTSSSGDGGRTSSSGDGGRTSSSGDGGRATSSSSGSSSGSAAVFDVTSVTVNPATAATAVEGTFTFELIYTGNPGDAAGNVAIIYGVTPPTGGEAVEITGLAAEPATEAGKLTGTFKMTPPVAGDYEVAIGFDGDQDVATTNDQKIGTDTVTVNPVR